MLSPHDSSLRRTRFYCTTVTVMVAEWVALPPTAAAFAVTVDVPRGTLKFGESGLEAEPQPATPRKNIASTNICSHRTGFDRDRPDRVEVVRPRAIENSARARKGLNRASIGLPTEPGPAGAANEAVVALVSTLNWTV